MAYLTPDRLAGKPAAISDDLYAIGVVGYEALTGRKPFPQDNLLAVARAIMDGRPPAIAALRPAHRCLLCWERIWEQNVVRPSQTSAT